MNETSMKPRFSYGESGFRRLIYLANKAYLLYTNKNGKAANNKKTTLLLPPNTA
jgi:hypothetical protein